MKSKSETATQLVLDNFSNIHPAPERGVKRILFLLSENGSIMRGLMRESGVKIAWWSSQPEKSSVEHEVSSDQSALILVPTVDSCETDLKPELDQLLVE